eukprot:CAMPEP_0113885710 /NCGR_PEP_ID=MMETSP0780_2-20120614/11080_1 /TAXON_ID=652834 /ORGANISM="Palpitomonas bilix" /LENGTH=893 /DNA_ID=CAMNT_0000873703 /DNA_START=165 /DNA_END=2843 /DNA_ORIENTATION=- /assembly_acc=CAM_ASM_000599
MDRHAYHRMTGIWASPVLITQSPISGGIRSCYPQRLILSNDGECWDWGPTDSLSPSLRPPYVVKKKPLLHDMFLFRDFKHGERAKSRNPNSKSKRFNDYAHVGHSSLLEMDEANFVVRICSHSKTTLRIHRQGNNRIIGTIQLTEPAERVWWRDGDRDLECNLAVQTRRGIHLLVMDGTEDIDGTQVSKKKKTVHEGEADSRCSAFSSPDEMDPPLIHSWKWKEDLDEEDLEGKHNVREVSFLSFESIQSRFPDHEEEAEVTSREEWGILFQDNKKSILYVQPPRSNRLIRIECSRDERRRDYTFLAVCSLQIKGVSHFWCDREHGCVFALHSRGFLLSWTFNNEDRRMGVPLLCSHQLITDDDEEEQQPHPTNGERFRLLYVSRRKQLYETVYYTRYDQDHSQLWKAIRVFPPANLLSKTEGSVGKNHPTRNKHRNARKHEKGSQTRKEKEENEDKEERRKSELKESMRHTRGEGEETEIAELSLRQTFSSEVSHIRYLCQEIQPDAYWFPLLPDLVQCAMSWKRLCDDDSLSPRLRRESELYKRFLWVQKKREKEKEREKDYTTSGDDVQGQFCCQEWYEACVSLLQNVRFSRDLLAKPISADLGIFFAIWKHLVNYEEPTVTELVNWTKKVGMPFSPGLEEDFVPNPETFVQEALWKPESFRLCLRFHIDLRERWNWVHPSTVGMWKGLENMHTSVWQTLMGNVPFVHLQRFYLEGVCPSVLPLQKISILSRDIKQWVKDPPRKWWEYNEEEDAKKELENNFSFLQENEKGLKRVFESVIETKAEFWKSMSLYLDQEEEVVDAFLPGSVKTLCHKIDRHIHCYLQKGNTHQTFSTEWIRILENVPKPSTTSYINPDCDPDYTLGYITKKPSLRFSFPPSTEEEIQLRFDW